MTETVMNLRGLKCPLPALRVRKKLSALKSGDTIVAECTDPLTMIDIPNLLRQTGDALESKSDADGSLLSGSARHDTADQSRLEPFARTKVPKSVRSGTAYCRALSSDQP